MGEELLRGMPGLASDPSMLRPGVEVIGRLWRPPCNEAATDTTCNNIPHPVTVGLHSTYILH